MCPFSRSLALLCATFFLAGSPLWSQARERAGADDPILFVGMKLEEMINRFGPPQAVYAARGSEEWQDDVVFVYSEGDFYVYKDRVWQIGLKAAYGIELGDARPVVFLVLGDEAKDEGYHVLLSIPGSGWPLMLRVNINGSGAVSAIFIYRPDF